jgi:hypothetical protein
MTATVFARLQPSADTASSSSIATFRPPASGGELEVIQYGCFAVAEKLWGGMGWLWV